MKFAPLKALPPVPAGDRHEFFDRLAAHANDQSIAAISKIEDMFRKFPALDLVAYCALYFVSEIEGRDREAEGRMDCPPNTMEILQALSLVSPEAPRRGPIPPAIAQALKSVVTVVNEATSIALLPPGRIENDRGKEFLQMQVRSHTAVVRNWSYRHLMERTTLDLAALVDEGFLAEFRLAGTSLMTGLLALTTKLDSRMTAHCELVSSFYRQTGAKELLEAFNRAFPAHAMTTGMAEVALRSVGKDVDEFRGYLTCCSDLALRESLTFELSDALSLFSTTDRVAVETILDRWSFGFGELANVNRDHLFLGNPVPARPLVKVRQGAYFSSVAGLFPHYARGLFEELVGTAATLKESYEQRRSQYLEDCTERLWRKVAPTARVLRNVYWEDSTGTTFETDLVVQLDRVLVVVECKSGRVTPVARRGELGRLKGHLGELIENSAVQAGRLIHRLRTDGRPLQVRHNNGIEGVIEPGSFDLMLPIGVLLDQLGSISSSPKRLLDADIVTAPEVVQSLFITVTDLEVIVDLLRDEAELIHYILRRLCLQRTLTYHADEMDLLAWYLGQGLQFRSTQLEIFWAISGKSKEIDPYVIGTSRGVAVAKPSRSHTKLWDHLLKSVRDARAETWILDSCALLSVPFAIQKDLEDWVARARARLLRPGRAKHCEWKGIAIDSLPPVYVALCVHAQHDPDVVDRETEELWARPEFLGARICVLVSIDATAPSPQFRRVRARLDVADVDSAYTSS
jgi:hypothetical protein